MNQPFDDPNIERAFFSFPDEVKKGLLYLRALIFDVAAQTEGVGRLEETLKWEQPAYLTPETKAAQRSGLVVPRLAALRSMSIVRPASCQTSGRSFSMILNM